MSETFWGVIIGGILAIVGGIIASVIQYLLSRAHYRRAQKDDELKYLRDKRQDSYLQLIDALLCIKVDDTDMIHFGDFSKKYDVACAKVKLYASKDLLNKVDGYLDDIKMCWDDDHGFDGIGAEIQRDKIISFIREEMKIN